jgi:hypothetical protein
VSAVLLALDVTNRTEAVGMLESFPDASLDPARILAVDEVIDYLRDGLQLAGISI